jgi:RNA polymerase sigma-70 factor (ECF subfamily)
MCDMIESTYQRAGDQFETARDDSLVVTAQNGGHLAYVELCRRHRRLVFQTVQRITKNKEDAEDILQDAWMRAFVYIKTFGRRSAFSTWLTRIAINSALMMLRKRRKRIEASLDDHFGSDTGVLLEIAEPAHNPEEHYIRAERRHLVRQAIGHLPPSLRSVIELRQTQDVSLKEIATRVGISLSATKSRLQRAKAMLREPLRGI